MLFRWPQVLLLLLLRLLPSGDLLVLFLVPLFTSSSSYAARLSAVGGALLHLSGRAALDGKPVRISHKK